MKSSLIKWNFSKMQWNVRKLKPKWESLLNHITLSFAEN